MTRQDRSPAVDHDGLRSRPRDAGGDPARRGELTHAGLDARDGATGTPQFDTGTTVVGLTAADAVILAADRRMSLGGRFTANKSVQKVEQVHPTAAMGISGSVGPAQDLLQSLRAEASLYESRRGGPMSLRALAQTAGGLVRGLPVTPLLGGVDPGASARVYELDVGGSVLADDYAATGSGMQVAYGVLERRFEPGLSVADARAAAVAAVEAASERDTASGNGVTVARVTDEAVTVEEPNDETPDTGDSAGEVA